MAAVQLVDFDGVYNIENAKSLIDSSGVQGTDYNIIGVIGCQSTGKSTMLNLLFDCNFHTMDASKGRYQVTQGIWFCKSPKNPFFVLDLEGADSEVRGEDGAAFEQMSSLFALAISDVLIVNMWTAEVGRYKAASVGLLKTIFEVNMKLFNREAKQRILFSLRDFNEAQNNLSILKQQINDTMQQIWKEIDLPASHRNMTVFDCFVFEFHTCAAKDFAPQNFKSDIDLLRTRLTDSSHEAYLLNDIHSDVPSDGIPLYLNTIWDQIQSEKDLNLPSQKEMIATLRCNEIRLSTVEFFSNEISDLRELATKELISDYSQQCEAQIAKALEFYDKDAQRYSKTVYESVRIELQSMLTDELRDMFYAQMKCLYKDCVQRFKVQLLDKINKVSPTENFTMLANQYIMEVMGYFERTANRTILAKSEWSYTEFQTDLDIDLKEKLEQEKQGQLKLLDEKINNDFRKIGHRVTTVLNDAMDDNFWVDINEKQSEGMKALEEYLLNILKGLEFDEAETNKYLEDTQQKCYDSIKERVTKHALGLDEYLTKKFTKWFKYDEKGVPRDWKTMENIEELYNQCKDRTMVFVYCFQQFKILANWKIYDPNFKDFSFEDLLTDEQIGELKGKFLVNADHAYNEALEKKEFGKIVGGVPKWVWLLLVLLGWNELVYITTSPIVFYPLGTVLCLAIGAFIMGKQDIIYMIARKVGYAFKIY